MNGGERFYAQKQIANRKFSVSFLCKGLGSTIGIAWFHGCRILVSLHLAGAGVYEGSQHYVVRSNGSVGE